MIRVAESEYQETLDKARGMARALDALLPDELPPQHGRPPLTKGFRFESDARG